MEELTISAVARLAGVRASTIRYYEELELLPAPRRVNGQRRYDASVLERLNFIQITQRLGFSLGEIHTLFEHQQASAPLPELWQSLAQQKLADVGRIIAHAREVQRLLMRGLRCPCPNMDDCIECVRVRCAPAGASQAQ